MVKEESMGFEALRKLRGAKANQVLKHNLCQLSHKFGNLETVAVIIAFKT